MTALRRCWRPKAATTRSGCSTTIPLTRAPVWLNAKFGRVHLVRSDRNLGFGRANNELVERTTSEYVLLANPDTRFTEDLLGPLVGYLEAHPDVGVVGPRIMGADGEMQLSRERFPNLSYELAWQIHGTIFDRLFDSKKLISNIRMEECNCPEPMKVEFLWATCWLVRREFIRDHGLFDPKFRLYDEDLDFCARLAGSRWEIHYYPMASIVHLGGMSRLSDRQADNDAARKGSFLHAAQGACLRGGVQGVHGISGRGKVREARVAGGLWPRAQRTLAAGQGSLEIGLVLGAQRYADF